MKRILSLIVVMMTVLSGCETKEEGNPKAVADQFIDAASRNDVPAMRNLSTIESRVVLNFLDSSATMGVARRVPIFKKENVQTGEAKISGDEALVPVTFKNSGERINLTLKKQLGQWKVSLDVNTYKQILNAKLREGGIFLDEAMRKMRNVNIDSLSKNIRINGKSVDSFKNAFKKRGISLDSLKKRKIDINF